MLAGRSAFADRPFRLVDGVKDAPDLVLHKIAEAFAAARTGKDGRDDPACRCHTDIGGNQQLLERLDGIDVDLRNTRSPGVCALHDLVETTENLLLGATQTLAQAVYEGHVPNPKSRIANGESSVVNSTIPPRSAAAAASGRTGRFARPFVRPGARPPER